MINQPHAIRTISVLVKKELATYFNSPIAYVVAAVFLAVGNWLFWKSFFLIGQASVRNYFNLLPWLLLFLVPAMTMRLWSEEKKIGTIELLFTWPISDWQIVLAKFLGSWLFIVFVLFLTFSLPLSVGGLGRLDLGAVLGGYLAAAGLSAVFLAVGLVASAVTKNQIIAFVAALAASFLLFIIGDMAMLSGWPEAITAVIGFWGAAGHYAALAKGVVDTRDLLYFFSLTLISLWINALILGWRKQ